MELTKQLEMLKELCTLDGVSGCEERVAEYLRAHLPQDCQVRQDIRGNLICEKKGRQTPKNKLMFTAHMDEVGFLIHYIEDSGLLRFAAVGSIDTRVVIGKPVRLESGKEGVVGAKPIHLQTAEERDEVLKVRDLYIDIGAKSREEAERFVQLGDYACWRPQFIQLGERVCSKALDNRLGCLLLLGLLEQQLEYDITAVFTVQEEIGGGAVNAAFAVEPDIAVVLDAGSASDVPGVSAGKRVCALGKGPVLSFQDKGAFMDRELFRTAKQVCEQQGIPYQVKNQIVDTNEAAQLSRCGAGCRVMAVSVPVRYTNSPSSVFEPKDLEPTLALLGELTKAFAQL